MSARAIILSDEQRAAIFTPGGLLVRAGAGSGKTEVLARRFAALAAGDIGGREPLAPDRIAAITFTDKAAWDMRARIEAVLREQSENSDGPRRTVLRHALRLLPLARISTIHAFCARILRENSDKAGLDPDFQVLDEHESRTYLEKICKRGFVDAVRRGDDGARYLVRARRMAATGMRESGLDIVMRIAAECARMGRAPAWIESATRRTADEIAARSDRVAELAAELIRETGQLLALKGLSPGAASRIAELRPQWPDFRRQIAALSRIAAPEAFDFLGDLRELLPTAQNNAVRPHVNAIREIVASADNSFGLGGALFGAYGEFHGANRAVGVAKLIGDIAAMFEDAKIADRLVTFDDLLVKVRNLLCVNPAVADRYRTAIGALLVDEYQDTDPVQDEIVRLLCAAGASDSPAAPELFIVGDEKQSIYRFRGADVRVFHEAVNSAPQRLPLRDNRRSVPNILAFVNALGADAMKLPAPPVPPYRVVWSADHELRPVRDGALDPAVEIITAIDGDASDNQNGGEGATVKLGASEKRPLEAAAIAARISALISGGEQVADRLANGPRPAEYRDIVILLRAFTDVAVYERALVNAGIPSYTVKGRGFFGCREVIDLIELLAAVNDDRDSPALAAALRSPFFMLSDRFLLRLALRHRERVLSGGDRRSLSLAEAFESYPDGFADLGEEAEAAAQARELLRELRGLRDRGSIIGVIEHALAMTGYEAVMLGLAQGRQRVANLRKLIELARDFQSRRFFNFHDFVAHLRGLVTEEPHEPPAQILGENEQVVRLMTVHQAKGLEFPIVIVADAGRLPGSDNVMPVLDAERGLVMRDAVGSGMDEIPNPMLDDYRAHAKDELEAESVRLLYVALTRARDRLIVSEGANLGDWAKKIRGFVGVDTIKQFIESKSERREVSRGGARIVLLRPGEAPAAAPRAPVPRAEANHLAEIARRRLAFAAPVSDELIASPTALADFDRCPRQYQLRRDRVREAELPGANGSGAAVLMGTVAHSVLEQIEFGIAASAADGEIRRLVETIGAAAGLESADRDEIARDLSRYLAQAPLAGMEIRREVPFFLNVSGAMFVRGRIDVIADDGERILVRDYKYARERDADSYHVQMECYALAAAGANPGRAVAAEIVFLRGAAAAIPIALPDMETIRERLMNFGRAIASQGAGEFPKKPPDEAACRRLRCGFVMRCWRD